MKSVWQSVKRYLPDESNSVFESAVINIWNGITLTEEEEMAVATCFQM